MLDIGVQDKVETVWGIAVPVVAGRRRWPEELRAKALDRISAGCGIREIAEELGANKSLVAHWVKRGSSSQANTVSFVEVLPPTSQVSKGKPPFDAPAESETMACRIRIGDAEIAIEPGYPVDHLTEVL
ncbi:helix-turn-helix domain-containing protein [Paracoccus sp. (in: a-proteobacteria)]|uniref:helix-turn-helix domain-containing protein n=1 Tax=Paracoccus sp. TaxID=267 RepID=UPI0028A27B9D|nr:helix-turn-helix domain-containing protein [Paracoccus sp. (in: a-proteobacteria)]